jgi:hypothetical protein
MARRDSPALSRHPSRKNIHCEPISQILVSAFAPGLQVESVICTSNADFLVYCATNTVGQYGVDVQSTGAGMGTGAPVFIVGGVANDVITFRISPGTTGFMTLQTRCHAKASITQQ